MTKTIDTPEFRVRFAYMLRSEYEALVAHIDAQLSPTADTPVDATAASVGELPPLPERDGDWAGDDWYLPDSMRDYANAAIAQSAAARGGELADERARFDFDALTDIAARACARGSLLAAAEIQAWIEAARADDQNTASAAMLELLTHIADVVDDANWQKIDTSLWNKVTRTFADQSTASGAAGWKMAPVKLTDEMRAAARDKLGFTMMYEAAIAAAPTPPEQAARADATVIGYGSPVDNCAPPAQVAQGGHLEAAEHAETRMDAGFRAATSAAQVAQGEAGPWKVLAEGDKPDVSRLVDVILCNGVCLMGRHYDKIDWSAVRDWRYATTTQPKDAP